MLKGRAVVLAILMMTSSLSLVLVNQVPSNIDISEDKIFTSSPEEKIPSFPSPGNPWIEESIFSRVSLGEEKIRVTVSTKKPASDAESYFDAVERDLLDVFLVVVGIKYQGI